MSHVIPSGHSLRVMRLAANLTQKELASRAGLSQSLVSRIEKGTVDPRLSTLKRILDTINTSRPKATIASEVMHGPVVYVETSHPIRTAIELMKRYDISQLPIMRNGYPVGSIQESLILKRLTHVRDVRSFFETPVQDVMEEVFPSIPPNTDVEDVIFTLSRGASAILVMEGSKMLGIITKIDVILNLLRSEVERKS